METETEKYGSEDSGDSPEEYKEKNKKRTTSRALLVFILALIFLPFFSTCVSSFYIPKRNSDSNFSILFHNITDDTLNLGRAERIENKNLSPIIPKHLFDYKFDDSDTQFSVLEEEQGKQIIELTYERGLLNHPHIIYSATENRINELWDGLGFFVTLLFALGLAIFERIFKYTEYCRARISEFGYVKGIKVILFQIVAFVFLPLIVIVLLQVYNLV